MYLADIFVCAMSLAGLPALSLPVGRSEGLPIGAQLIAPFFEDERMLAAAAASSTWWPPRRGPVMAWETVIGLEVHVQLRTRTKMFCGCRTTFGDPPNTNVCPTCLGLPGALPVPNAEAIRLADTGRARAGLHRASDQRLRPEELLLSRSAQGLSDLPVRSAARHRRRVAFDSPDRGRIEVGITRLHVEEDAGKLVHDRFPGKTAVDLNRAGTPLAEIVSEPDLRSPAEARAYLIDPAPDPGLRRRERLQHGAGEPPGRREPLDPAAGRPQARHQDRGEEPELLRQRRARARGRARAADRRCSSGASGWRR